MECESVKEMAGRKPDNFFVLPGKNCAAFQSDEMNGTTMGSAILKLWRSHDNHTLAFSKSYVFPSSHYNRFIHFGEQVRKDT